MTDDTIYTEEEKDSSVDPKNILQSNSQDVVNEIITNDDPAKMQDLMQLFNLNMMKKNIMRRLKLENLLDYVSDSMLERFEKRPDEMSNKDLIDFMNSINSAIEKNHKNIQTTDSVPQISINNQQNNQVNITIQDDSVLPRESRERVLDFIQNVLNTANNQEIDTVLNSEDSNDEIQEEEIDDNE